MCICDQGHMKKMRVCLIYNYMKCLCVWLYWMCIWYHGQVDDMGDNSCIWSLKEMLQVQSPQNVFQTVLNAKVLKKRIAWFVLKDFKVDLKLKYMYIVSFSLDDPQLESFIVKEAELSTINQVNLKILNILFFTINDYYTILYYRYFRFHISHFLLSLYRALRLKEIKIVWKWSH